MTRPELIFGGAFFCGKVHTGSKPMPMATFEYVHANIFTSLAPKGLHGVVLLVMVTCGSGMPHARLKIVCGEEGDSEAESDVWGDEHQFSFVGETRYFMTKIPINATFEHAEWYDIFLNDQLVTSVPFRIVDDQTPHDA